MKIRVLFLVLGFLVILAKPVGAVNLHDYETEISCFIDNQGDALVVDIFLNPGYMLANENALDIDGFLKSKAEEARPPNLEVSKVYRTTKRLLSLKGISRRPRDGLRQYT